MCRTWDKRLKVKHKCKTEIEKRGRYIMSSHMILFMLCLFSCAAIGISCQYDAICTIVRYISVDAMKHFQFISENVNFGCATFVNKYY